VTIFAVLAVWMAVAPIAPALGEAESLAQSTVIEGCVDPTSARLRIATANAPCASGEIVLQWPALQDAAPAHLVRGCVSRNTGQLKQFRWRGRFGRTTATGAAGPPVCKGGQEVFDWAVLVIDGDAGDSGCA
jgi:hypothetical protein